MKATTKIKMLAIMAILGFYSSNTYAQENTAATSDTKNYDQGFKLGFGINAGQSFDDPYELALGADARIQYDLSKRSSITLTSGFSNLFIDGDDNDLGFVPVKAGFKAFVWEDKFYVMGEVGGAFPVTNDYDQNSLVVAPSIGYATKYIDISIRYDYYKDFQNSNDGTINDGVRQLGVRFAYGFRL